jgi:hypothetical protein
LIFKIEKNESRPSLCLFEAAVLAGSECLFGNQAENHADAGFGSTDAPAKIVNSLLKPAL